MIGELKVIFQTQARAERYEFSEKFFYCKMEDNNSISKHMLRMSRYIERLGQLGIVIPNKLGKGTDHWKRNCPKYLADKKAGNLSEGAAE